jgi:hypothetical protein
MHSAMQVDSHEHSDDDDFQIMNSRASTQAQRNPKGAILLDDDDALEEEEHDEEPQQKGNDELAAALQGFGTQARTSQVRSCAMHMRVYERYAFDVL